MTNRHWILGWLPDHRHEWLRPDIFAGLTTGAVVVPKAMAYATVAGLPVQVGIYTAFVPMVIYALLGTSRPLSVSTTTTLGILTGAQLAAVAPTGDPAQLLAATATLTVLVGVMLLAASLLRLGAIASFISEPVLTGFKAGVGLVIVLDQVPKLLGIHFDKGSFLHNLVALVGHLPQTSLATLAVGIAMLAILVGLERFSPRTPAPLAAMAVGIAASGLLALQTFGVETVGEIPLGLPAYTAPNLALVDQLWPGALGIALMSFTESIAAARAFAGRDEPRPDPNRELIATGLGNVAGGLFGAMPGGGGTSQTAVNRSAGARSQLAGLVTAGVSLATLLLLAPLLGLMPQATLAAVVIVYSIGLIEPAEFRAILRIRRMEFLWAAAAFAGVVVLGTLKGIVVAVIISLVALSYQAARPKVYVPHRARPPCDRRARLQRHPRHRVLGAQAAHRGRRAAARAGHPALGGAAEPRGPTDGGALPPMGDARPRSAVPEHGGGGPAVLRAAGFAVGRASRPFRRWTKRRNASTSPTLAAAPVPLRRIPDSAGVNEPLCPPPGL